jgi:hypothetical protein
MPASSRQRRRSIAAAAALALAAAACTPSDDGGTPKGQPRGVVTPPGADDGVSFTPTPIDIVEAPETSAPLESACSLPTEYMRRIRRGYHPGKSPDIIVVPREPNFFGGFVSTSHSGPWDYLQRVPMVFYGPGFIRPMGQVELDREVTLADLAPTLAELLGTAPPPGTVGRPLREILVRPSQRRAPPRVIVTVVWDGGGWNVLDAWPDSWPTLARLIEDGANMADATVGSSPSVTPAIHATIGTGVYPKQHGITGIEMRIEDEGVGIGAFRRRSPEFLLAPTLADVFDPRTGNAAQVGMFAYKSWHLGMIGHGASWPGGDADIATILTQSEKPVTNTFHYSLPDGIAGVPGLRKSIRTVDLDDGKLDATWMGHEILNDPTARRDTPAWVLYQTRIIKAVLTQEGFGADSVPDLFYTNYKQIDEVGHNWNMVNPEMDQMIRYSDAALGDLVTYLNHRVGEGRWVLAVTADHGQGPDPKSSGAWPINMGELQGDVERHFGAGTGRLISSTSPAGFWLDRLGLNEAAVTEDDIAAYLLDYRLADNVTGDPPPGYEPRLKEPLLSAAWPSALMDRAWECARAS